MKTMILVGVVFQKLKFYYFLDVPAAARSVRYDKSLGVLCQKFVMLFLISAVSCTKTLCDFQYNSVMFDVTLYFFSVYRDYIGGCW